MVLVIVLFLLIVVLWILEERSHRKNLDQIPLRILVNGTRGKTTITRLIAASLRENGIKTIARTTGSSAEVIYPDGRVEKVRRKGRATVLEMIPFFRTASSEKVDAVVVECMALSEENQKAIASFLVRPGIVVMANTYVDHVPEMGWTQKETAEVLSQSIPKGAKLYTTEDYYDSLECEVHKVKVDTSETIEGSIPIHGESWSLARSLLLDLGVAEEVMVKAKDKITPDIGLLSEMKVGKNSVFLPYFSINDRECMASTIKSEAEKHEDKRTVLVFNNRRDREHRIILIREAIAMSGVEGLDVAVIGDYREKVCRYFSRRGISSFSTTLTELKERIAGSENTLFLGLGNIKGAGEELISLVMGEEK